MMNKAVKLTIDSVLENVSLIGIATNAICSSIVDNKEEVYQMELCVVEAVNNCIEHAYKNKSGHEVEVIIELNLDNIIFKVCDTGENMEPGKVSEFSFNPDDIASLPEGGMGLFLIHQIMDEVSYENIGKRNILTMTKELHNQKTI
ncbi:MAG: ATP-binding protein [Thermodesulfobacteriota bacterium]|nr:ATP-binding protein [Thermodesulfobacteriota bacterium]